MKRRGFLAALIATPLLCSVRPTPAPPRSRWTMRRYSARIAVPSEALIAASVLSMHARLYDQMFPVSGVAQ